MAFAIAYFVGFCLLFQFLPLVISACIGQVTQAEFFALQDLFEATGGSSWRWSAFNQNPASRWSFPSDPAAPCSIPWQGIDCSMQRDPILPSLVL